MRNIPALFYLLCTKNNRLHRGYLQSANSLYTVTIGTDENTISCGRKGNSMKVKIDR